MLNDVGVAPAPQTNCGMIKVLEVNAVVKLPPGVCVKSKADPIVIRYACPEGNTEERSSPPVITNSSALLDANVFKNVAGNVITVNAGPAEGAP